VAALFAAILVSVVVSPGVAQAPARCVGDCNNDGEVTVDDLLRMVAVGLGQASGFDCPAADANADRRITPDEILRSVGTALTACPPPLQDEDALTASARVAVSTMESVSIMDFGFIGFGAGAGGAADGGTCAGGGTKDISCTAGDASTSLTTVFANCSEPGQAPGTTITRSGTVVRTVEVPNACSKPIPSNANTHLRFSTFTASQVDANGNRSTLTTGDLVLDVDASAFPTTVHVTANGMLEVSNTGAAVERFTQTFRNFVVTQTTQAADVLVSESGSMTVDCLGEVRFDTKVPIRVAAGDACPSGGLLEVALPGFNPAGGAAAMTKNGEPDQPTRRLPALSANDTLPPAGYREFAVRAANGQVYQILQNADGDATLKTEDVQVTTVVGSDARDAGGCFALSQVQALVAAGPGNAFPIAAVRRSPLIADASPPCFNPNGSDGNGAVCIGPECTTDCACAAGGRCTTFTFDAGAPLATGTEGVRGATVDRLMSVAAPCSGFQGRDTYGFGTSVPTTGAGVCSSAPDDGVTLGKVPSVFQSVDGSTLILAYATSLTAAFDTASAGFAVDRNGDAGCEGSDTVIAGVIAAHALPRPNVRFGATGSVAFDFNADKRVDKVFSSCRAVSLSQCAAPPAPTPTPGPPPACQPFDLGNTIPVGSSGTTAINPKNTTGGASCGGGGNEAPDFTFKYTAPDDGFYTIDTIGSQLDTVLYVRAGECAGRELACNDDRGAGSLQSEVGLSLSKNQVIVITVDGSATQSGQFLLHINSSATPPTPTPTVMGGPVLPDLVVTAVTAPSSGTIGGQIDVSASIANQGLAEADAFQVDFLYSADVVIAADDVRSGFGCVFSGLSVGQTVTCSGPTGVPSSLAPGNYFLGALVDLPQQIEESNEANNARAADAPIAISGTLGTPTSTPTRTMSGAQPATQTPTPTQAVTSTATPTRTPTLRTATATVGGPMALSLSPRAVALAPNGGQATLTLSITQPATTPATVTLSLADPNVASVPPSVTIPIGEVSTQATVQGKSVGTTTLTATGPGTAAASIYVTAPFSGTGTFVAPAVSVDIPALPVMPSPIEAGVRAPEVSIEVPAVPAAPGVVSVEVLALPVGIEVQ